MVQNGIKGYQEDFVTEDKLAKNVGSGLVRVYATPQMIALIEKTAVLSVEPYLEAPLHCGITATKANSETFRPIFFKTRT